MNLFSYEYHSQFFVTLENFTANNNSWPYFGDRIRSAIQAIYVTSLALKNVSITNNNMAGLTVYHTAVVVNDTLVFHNNTGIDGGGLSMYGDSYLMFHRDSIANFTNNSAKHKGGAIFVDSQLAFAPCFFQYSDRTLPPKQALYYLEEILAIVSYFVQIKHMAVNALIKHSTIQHRLGPQ